MPGETSQVLHEIFIFKLKLVYLLASGNDCFSCGICTQENWLDRFRATRKRRIGLKLRTKNGVQFTLFF